MIAQNMEIYTEKLFKMNKINVLLAMKIAIVVLVQEYHNVTTVLLLVIFLSIISVKNALIIVFNVVLLMTVKNAKMVIFMKVIQILVL